MIDFDSLKWFAMYFVSGIAMFAIFVRLYMFITPYNEVEDITAGKLAPAIALTGAMIGVTIPMVTMSYHGSQFVEYVIWSAIAGVVQLIGFTVLYKLLPRQIEANNCAAATVFAGSAICIGLFNAFSLIP